MDVLCKSTFWDWNQTWFTDDPEFSLCFRRTALVWLPCGFLWIFLPLEIRFLTNSKTRDIPYNFFNVIKLVIIIIASLLKGNEAVHNMVSGNSEPIVYFYSTVLECFSLVLFFSLTWANIKRGIRSSGILFVFSFLSVICGIPEMKSVIQQSYHFFNYSKNGMEDVSYTLYFICMVIVFLINCFADEKPQRSTCLSHKKTYPFTEASFISKLFLLWFDSYIWSNHEQSVKTYLWDLDSKNCAKDIPTSRQTLKSTLKKNETESAKLSILSILHKEHWFQFWSGTILRTIWEILTTGLFFIYYWLLSSLEANEPTWKAYFYTSLFFVNILIQSILLTKHFEIGRKIELRVKGTTISCIYKKTLRISNAVRKTYSTSTIVNLMSADTFQLQNGVVLVHYFLSMCIQVVVSHVFLWYLLGNTVFISALTVMAIIVCGYFLTKRMKALQKEATKHKDIRSKFMHEIFSGIKVLKMYAWERSFEKVAINLRQQENKTFRKIAIINTLFQELSSNSSYLSSLAAFVGYVLITQNTMGAQITFVSFTIFNYFRIPFNNIPQMLLMLQQLRISIKRMDDFLNSEELDDSAISHDITTDERLIMQNASFSWDSNEGPATLKNINMKADDNSLVAIIGPVGAGKTSLISAFLGEMYKLSGYVNTKGTTAYVPQQAWILNTTIKENITLGDNIEQSFYKRTIEACALDQDLKALADGDSTEIGEKGINLSGGQKQRISLARAVCQNAEIYFFDDPLSAVDSHVANHIFQNVLGENGLLKHKTRILVTHSTKFFPFMDKIIVMKNGGISEMGSYQELLKNEGDFIDFVRTHVETEESLESERNSNEKENKIEPEQPKKDEKVHFIASENIKKPPSNKLIKDEIIQVKRVDHRLYWEYFKAGGLHNAFTSLFMLTSFQTILVISNVYLSKWVTSDDAYDTKYSFVVIYTLYGIIQVITMLLAAFFFYKTNLKACANFYHNLLRSILHWSMASFDSTPIGRIISRIGDDIFTLDNYVAFKMLGIFALSLRFSSIFVYTICIIPTSSFIIIPVIAMYFILRKKYVNLYHKLKRIEAINKSPFYSHLAETVAGIQTIRAFKLQEKFTFRCYERADLHSASYHSSVTCKRWFNSRVEILEGLTLCSLASLAIFERDTIPLGHIALQIALTLQMVRGFVQYSDIYDDVEDGIIAVERISEYLAFPQEPDWDKSSVRVSDAWPEKGEITFDNYKLRYREGSQLVLRGISLTIKSGEKVGIVGRTGAGKTSIIQGLFRIVEPAGGAILIDNVDITKVALHALRSKLTVIPQDPILFYGTLRFNLDPFDKYPDEFLWDILEKSHLRNFVKELPAGLNYMIDEGGQNLSFGQRQLICLARALLRKSKILILDEATASVDVKTDELIQKTIREEFSHCTVITIAHRLNTLQDYDKILILDGGLVLNFDTTENLLNSSNSQFRSMILESELK